MNFIEAVRLAKEGKKIRRSCWGKEEWISAIYTNFSWILRNPIGSSYIPNVDSFLDENWEIYKESIEDIKIYTFQEALLAFNEGKTISRLFTRINFRRDIVYPGTIYKGTTRSQLRNITESIFSYDDICATDWIIYDKENPLGFGFKDTKDHFIFNFDDKDL